MQSLLTGDSCAVELTEVMMIPASRRNVLKPRYLHFENILAFIHIRRIKNIALSLSVRNTYLSLS